MKIATKFFTGSAASILLIGSVLFSNTVVVQEVKHNIQEKSNQTTETIKATLELENALKSEIIALNDILLFETNDLELHKSQIQFQESLTKLERLMPETEEIPVIRRRHAFLVEMANKLDERERVSENYLTDYQQYFRVINSFRRDIDLFLNDLVEKAYQQNLIIEQQLETLDQLQRIISFIVVGVIVILFVVKFLVIWRPTIRYLQKLQAGTAEIADGNLNYRLEIHTGDEIEDLAQAFNHMAIKLTESRATLLKNTELTQMNQRLELEISERKQAELELYKALKELQDTQAQLIQTEKMSSLGQLVAGVAHEINNPVNFIYGNITHASECIHELLDIICLYQEEFPHPGHKIEKKTEEIDLEFLLDDLPKIFSSMKMGTQRIRQIVLSLRNFSRLDEAEMKEVDIHEGIESTLLILQNRLKAKPDHSQICIIKDYGHLPLVECYAGQLNQVFMNIINNAIDAIESCHHQRSYKETDPHPSQILIHTEIVNKNQVLVRIADNGPGMTEEVKQKLFDPFFTTKPVGQGTGLGLSISYQIIVQKHSGKIWCESEIGKGTEFIIEIPLRQEKKQVVSQLDMKAIT